MFSNIENNITRPLNLFTQEIEKMKKGELILEDILSNNDIVQDIKTNANSQFFHFFTNDIILKLIDYSLKMPKSDDHKIGYQYPFNATEILCSNCPGIQDRLMTGENNDIIEDGNNIEKENIIEEIKKNENENGIINNDNIKEENKTINILNDDSENNKEKELNDDIHKENNENKLGENKNNQIIIKDENIEKKIKTKNISNTNKYIIIDYLFNFLNDSNSENNSNYILVGYFCKILNNLIDIQSDKIINYIYDYQNKENLDFLSILIKKMNFNSICETIQKILLYNNQKMINLENKKILFIQNILKELQNTQDNKKIYFICNTISKSIANKSFFNFFMKNINLVKMLFDIIDCDKKNGNGDKNKSILQLFTKINENILKNFEKKFTPDIYQDNQIDYTHILGDDANNIIDEDQNYIAKIEYSIKDILKILFDILKNNELYFLNDLYDDNINDNNKNNNIDEFMATYERKQKKMGIKKLLQIEYLRSLLDLLVNSYVFNYHKKEIKELIDILNKKKLFYSLHQIFFNFPFCNIFQIYYCQIIDIITNIYTPDYIVENFLKTENKSLISDIIENMLEKTEFIFNSKRNALNPCLIYEVNILNQLMNCNNDSIQNIIEEDKDLKVFNEVLADNLNKIIKMQLLYNENNEQETMDNETELLDNKSFFFGTKNIFDIINEGKNRYKIYKCGGDYKNILNEEKDKT